MLRLHIQIFSGSLEVLICVYGNYSCLAILISALMELFEHYQQCGLFVSTIQNIHHIDRYIDR